MLQGPLACDAHAAQAPTFASHVYRHPHSDAQLSISRSRVHLCLQALLECLRMCLGPTIVSAPFTTLVETASPCSTSGIPYERALYSLHGMLDARSRPTAQLSSVHSATNSLAQSASARQPRCNIQLPYLLHTIALYLVFAVAAFAARCRYLLRLLYTNIRSRLSFTQLWRTLSF